MNTSARQCETEWKNVQTGISAALIAVGDYMVVELWLMVGVSWNVKEHMTFQAVAALQIDSFTYIPSYFPTVQAKAGSV